MRDELHETQQAQLRKLRMELDRKESDLRASSIAFSKLEHDLDELALVKPTTAEEAQYSGIRFSTDLGEFTVAKRDGGIEVYFEGGLVFSPADLDENPEHGERPGFMLRAADKFAPHALLHWIQDALTHNVVNTKADFGQHPESNLPYAPNSEPPIPHEKIAGACEHLADMIRHQAKFGCKIPD